MRPTTLALISASLACGGSACCSEPPDYYAAAEGKTGQPLRQALHEIIDDHLPLAYTLTDEAFATTDRDPSDASRVTLIYSRRSEPAHCCTGEWNREHLWPNSLGIDKQLPPYSDLHNLRPSDDDVNAERGHKYFDETEANPSAFADPAHHEAPLCSTDSDSWEPPESVKGDIARAMFYMAIRYEGGAGEPDLELTDKLDEITTDASKMGRLTTLLIWHLIDPVSESERLRNDAVFTHQGNRNPFIDHPEWVPRIWPTPLQIEPRIDGSSAAICWPAAIPRAVIEHSANRSPWEAIDETPDESDGTLSIRRDAAAIGRRSYRLSLR